MNRIYSLVFNRHLGVTQVASEKVTSVSGGRVEAPASAPLKATRLATAIGAWLVFGTLASPAFAQSTGSAGGTAVYAGNGGAGNGHGGNGAGYASAGAGGSAASADGTGGTGGTANINGTAAGGDGGAAGVWSPSATAINGVDGVIGIAGPSSEGAYPTYSSGGGGGGGAGSAITTDTVVSNQTVTGGRGGAGGYADAYSGGGGGGGSGILFGGAGLTMNITGSAAVTGGAGGGGGEGGDTPGGGGGGGDGVYVTGAGTSISNAGATTGGIGGQGGSFVSWFGVPTGTGGGGGSGGAGVNGSFFSLINTGTIAGGAGGAGGNGTTMGAGGSGGVGVIATGGSYVVNSGLIAGGLGASGVQANAIEFSGGGNALVLMPGYAFTGNVVSSSASANGGDTLALGASSDTSFDVGVIGGLFQGFALYAQTGAGTATLTGTTADVTPWVIANGTLAISDDASLGSSAGKLTLNGGTLETRADVSASRDVEIGSQGGAIEVDAGTTATFTGTVVGDGSLTQVGTGTLNLGGSVTLANAIFVTAGASMNIGASVVAGALVDNGSLVVDGASSSYTGALSVGDGGTGELRVSNGAMVSASGDMNIGNLQGDAGRVTVTHGGTLAIEYSLNVGQYGTGDMTVSNGGTLNVNYFTSIGDGAGSVGHLLVTGIGSTLNEANYALAVGTHQASGTLTIADGAVVTAPMVVVGQDGSSGTLNIGAAAGDAAEAAGRLVSNDGQLILGDGTGAASLVFNHTDTDYGFDLGMYGNGSVDVVAGRTVLGADSSYAGGTTIRAGASLQLGNGGGAGSITGDVLNNGTLAFEHGGTSAFDGVVSGNGNLKVVGGTEVLSSVNTYTGSTTIDSNATLALTGAGSVAASNGVLANGAFDISQASGNVPITTLSGNGEVVLGDRTLLLTTAHGTFDGVISGNGGLDVLTGIETLTGANTYGGTTTIASGAMLALSGNGSAFNSTVLDNGTLDTSQSNIGVAVGGLAGNGVVILGSMGMTLAAADDTFTGTILGSGGLTVSGGTQTLTAASPFTGEVLIDSNAGLILSGAGSVSQASGVSDDGTFDISGTTNGTSITTLSGNGSVSLGDKPLTLSNASDTFAGNIGGTGDLIVAAGTEVLSGGNAYTGATHIASGATLALGGTGSIADSHVVDVDGAFDIGGTSAGASVTSLSGSGSVVLGAQTLKLTDAGDTFAGVIGGSGALQVNGGSEVLAGTNTYTGGTTIARGATLQLGNGGTTGSIVGGVANDGSLVFDRSDDVEYVDNVSGRGRVVKLNTDTVLLSGANSYTGGTTLAAGTLGIGSAGAIGTGTLDMAAFTTISFANSFTLANRITLSGDPTVDVASGVTTTLSGSIADGTESGDLVKTGQGTLVLDGVSTYTGATEVANGTLDVQGSAVSTVTVDDGATVSGIGTVGGLNVLGGGTVTPAGDRVGTLAVTGNVRFASGSRYQIDGTNAGASDLIHATGTATLNGGSVIGLLAGTGWQALTSYTILSADGGVSGSFENATSNFAFLAPTLSYDANHAYLVLKRNDADFASVAATRNQGATAEAAQSLASGSPVYDRLVGLDAGQARAAFEQLSGASLAGARTAVVNDSRYVRDAIGNHLHGVDGASSSDAQGSVWSSTWGHWGKDTGDINTGRQTSNGSGLLVGADRSFGDIRLGAIIGHGQLSTSSGPDDSHGTVDHAGIYLGADLGPWQLQGGAAHSWYQLTSHRSIEVEGLAGSADARYDVGVTQVYADGGFRIDLGKGSITPFVNMARTWVHQGNIAEQGNPAALRVQSNGSSVDAGTAGLRASFAPRKGMELHASVGYQRAWGELRSTDTQRFAGGGDSFTVSGVPVARNAGLADVGVKFDLRSNLSVDASYHGQFSGVTKDQSARLSLNMTF